MTTDPLLRELVLETPWNIGVLEHAIERARSADLADDEIRNLLAQGGPEMVHAYVAAMEPHMLYDCWCGESHWVEPLGGSEASRNLIHGLLAPFGELVRWLNQKLEDR